MKRMIRDDDRIDRVKICTRYHTSSREGGGGGNLSGKARDANFGARDKKNDQLLRSVCRVCETIPACAVVTGKGNE